MSDLRTILIENNIGKDYTYIQMMQTVEGSIAEYLKSHDMTTSLEVRAALEKLVDEQVIEPYNPSDPPKRPFHHTFNTFCGNKYIRRTKKFEYTTLKEVIAEVKEGLQGQHQNCTIKVTINTNGESKEISQMPHNSTVFYHTDKEKLIQFFMGKIQKPENIFHYDLTL